MKTAVITGASSGLGKAIYEALGSNRWDARFNWSPDTGVDVASLQSVEHASAVLETVGVGKVDVLINCAGINWINYLEHVKEEDFQKVMAVNAQGIFNTAKALRDKLAWGGTILNIVSNASHVPMTASLAYNASKAAALMMTKQLARELMPRYGITVFSVSPNKLAGTGMSKDIEEQVCKVRGWTKEQARDYQLKSLITGEETSVEDCAEFIAWLLSEKRRHKWFCGCDIPYGL